MGKLRSVVDGDGDANEGVEGYPVAEQLAWRCVSNPLKLHAGKELVRASALGQLLGNVLQRRRICRINQFSEVVIGLLPRLCSEPKGGEQHRSVFNEVVGGVHNEVVVGV